MAVVTGQSFGNFQVVRLIGEGGFGEVYEAENPFLQRRAAVKVLHAGMLQDAELVRRFLNEARAASAMRHPNIVDVFDAGVTPDGEPYILMEFLEGDSLQKIISQQGRLELATVLEVARQAGSALSAAHLAGIVHRDLKPENLFLIPDPSAPLGFTVKVLDFGIAKVKHRDDRGSTLKTQAGLLMGSPAYMSPEQCRDSSDVDHRTDIYSLAIMVYEMLAGAPPFTSNSATEMLVMQIAMNPPPLRDRVRDLPEHVEQAIARALSKDRDLRYGNVDYFVGALQGSYPAATAHGNVESSAIDMGGIAERPMSRAGMITPAPLVLGPLSGKLGTTPAPVVLSKPTLTTLSRSTGERTAGAAESRADFDAIRPRRWPIIAAAGVVVAVAALLASRFLSEQTTTAPAVAVANPAAKSPAASPAMVKVMVRSVPAGATVLDQKQGTVLGVTPLEKAFLQGAGELGLVLRLDGHKEKAIAIGLDGNSSTSVDLEPAETPSANTSKRPELGRPKVVSPRPRRPPKPLLENEKEWRLH
jgi:eukaryotic-like serine/threonine-protein kinase